MENEHRNLYETKLKYVRKPRSRIIRTILALLLILAVAAVFMLIINWKKIRQYRAEKAFMELVNNDYNWCEYLGEGYEYMVAPNDLDYSIVYLDKDQLPVLFLTTPNYSHEAAGRSRIITYNEETGQCQEIWGVINRIVVRGYIPADENHEYPLIFCEGIHQSVMHELIYEYRNSELVLLAERNDIWPYNSDRDEGVYPGNSDEYIWQGEQVGIADYYILTGMILDGYQDIQWIVRHPTTTYMSIEYITPPETEGVE